MDKESIDRFFENTPKEELKEKWDKYSKYSTNFERVKDYFENTPKEQIEKDWKETEKYDQVGPTIVDFTQHTRKLKTILEGYTQEEIDEWLRKDNERLTYESNLDLSQEELKNKWHKYGKYSAQKRTINPTWRVDEERDRKIRELEEQILNTIINNNPANMNNMTTKNTTWRTNTTWRGTWTWNETWTKING